MLKYVLQEEYYTKKELYVIKLRYKYFHSYTEIGNMMNLSQTRIRQIIIDIICKTRYRHIREVIFSNKISTNNINLILDTDYDDWYHNKNFIL